MAVKVCLVRSGWTLDTGHWTLGQVEAGESAKLCTLRAPARLSPGRGLGRGALENGWEKIARN